MKRSGTFASLILVTSLFALSFQNCTQAASETTSKVLGSTATEALSLYSSATELALNESAQLTAYGGVSPYTFSLEAGAGTLDPSTGAFVAPDYATTVLIAVTDAEGSYATITLSVSEATSSDPTTSLTCASVTVTSDQACYGGKDAACSVSVDFSAYVPSGCKVTQVIANARHFSATSGSCSTAATFTYSTSGALGSGSYGNKVAYLQSIADFDLKTIELSSIAMGWGSCGGNPCNACVSNVSLELNLTPE
jgi:hypothetical protein